MKRILYTLAQVTWGLPQTLLGALLFLRFVRCPHFPYHGSICTVWPARSSVSLGLFVFVSPDPHRSMTVKGRCAARELGVDERLVVHEYGHCSQSLIFGPLYLVVIGLPSLLWAQLPALRRRRARTGRSYYTLYTERFANYLGELVTKHETPK